MRKTSIHWILLGVLGLAPTALLAQQTARPKTKAAVNNISTTKLIAQAITVPEFG